MPALTWCSLSCAVAARNRDDGDCGSTLSRICQSLQGGGGVVVGRGGEGEMAGGEAEIVFGGEGGGLGDGALEDGLGFGELLEVDEGVGAVGDEGGVVRDRR